VPSALIEKFVRIFTLAGEKEIICQHFSVSTYEIQIYKWYWYTMLDRRILLQLHSSIGEFLA
jgi:hypothetical protein